jgi:GR25 family glycosyltransferase involved in LPS biosynthesis
MLADHSQIFSCFYEGGRWAEATQPGSTLEATRPYRAFIEQFVIEHNIRSVLDVGCGVANYLRAVDWKGARYVGLDVVPSVVGYNREHFPHVEFLHGDGRHLDAYSGFDLLLAKDVLQHWSQASIRAFLEQPALASFKHILIVNCDDERLDNAEIADGDWRPVNLLAPPLAMPEARPVFRFGSKRILHRGPRCAVRALWDRFEWWIINLDGRQDRLRHARAQLARIGVASARRFQAFDGHRLQLTSSRPDWVRRGAVGCYLSHLALLKQAQARRMPCVIVEDDLVFADDFLQAFATFVDEMPEDWDVLHLSGGEHCTAPRVLGGHHMRLVATWGTSMSFLRLPAIDRLLEEADALDRPVDDFYIRMMPSLKFYAPVRKIVWQECGLGTNIGDHG